LVLVIVAGTYYVSRFWNWVNFGATMINVTAIALSVIMYLFNSGIAGPTDLFFLLFLLLAIGISPNQQYKFWIPLNIGIYLSLIAYEYFNPAMLADAYNSRSSRFIDHSSAYVVAGAIAYFCIAYIRDSYEKERQAVTEKTAAIEEKNRQIVEQNKELERLNSEKNKLMSIVAHDLRSPLGNIQSFLELLTQDALEENEKLEIEQELLNSTNNTMTMLSKLLNWSKTQLHGVTAQPENLNLSKLLEPTISLERQAAEQKNIRIRHEFDTTIVIYADADMMQLILRNILGNAVKFTKPGGNILIRSELSGTNCIISVKDDGIGIPKERHNAIFSLNVQSTFGTKNEKGVGLGLMLCQEFIQAQNGSIRFESEPGSGTTFYITIPLSSASKTDR
jgi:two-component system sensor histidine kinase/response regulator